MQKPSFTVSGFVVACLVVLGLGVRELQPRIPPLPANSLARESSLFLNRASNQPINWQPFDKDLFTRARQKNAPIFLMIGDASSLAAEHYDSIVFMDPDTTRFLNQRFLCARIDAAMMPEWGDALLPLSRQEFPITGSCQFWILDGEARVMTLVGPKFPFERPSASMVTEALNTAYRRFITQRSKEGNVQDAQRLDLAMISNGSSRILPDQIDFADLTANSLTYDGRGFITQETYRFGVGAWKYLSAIGRVGEDEAEALSKICYSNWFDFVNGGFFTNMAGQEERRIDAAKIVSLNAEILPVLASQHNLFPDKRFDWFLKKTADFLVNCAPRETRPLYFGLEDTRAGPNRSKIYSFSLRRSERVIKPEDQATARDALHLDLARNPRMVPYIDSPEGLDNEKALELLAKFKEDQIPAQGIDTLRIFPTAMVAAKLFEASRISGDPYYADLAFTLTGKIEALVTPEGIGTISTEDLPDTILDYLTVSDAYLQQFLTVGSQRALEEGARIFSICLTRFGTAQPGNFLSVPKGERMVGARSGMPVGLVNIERESTVSMLIRLGANYGRILSRARFRQVSFDVMRRYADLVNPRSVGAAFYFLNSLAIRDETHAFSVGLDSVERASELQRIAPWRLVAPAFGIVRPDLQTRKPGFYVVRGDAITGPLSLEEAGLLLTPYPVD